MNVLKSITMRQACDEWLTWTRSDVKPSTACRYEEIILRHIDPQLGECRLDELTTARLDEWICFLRTEGRVDRSGPLSAKTVNCILSVVKLVLDYAREHDYDVAPILIHYPRHRATSIRILTPDDQRRLEDTVISDGTVKSLGILLSLYTGLRIGEVCGLRWSDWDPATGLLSVSRTVSRISGGDNRQRTRVIIDTPKTESSCRVIPVPTFLNSIITSHLASPETYILSGKMTPAEPRVFYTYYRRFLRRAGLPDYNYHALRHTFATRCVEHGCDPRTLSEILGHADITTTLRRYVHPTMELKRRELERMANGCRSAHKL